jgi:hypothetical protein
MRAELATRDARHTLVVREPVQHLVVVVWVNKILFIKRYEYNSCLCAYEQAPIPVGIALLRLLINENGYC